jgi:hypothetical protein
VKIERALAIAARARVRRRISSDPAVAQSDGTGAMSSSERLVLRDARGRFVKGHAGGPGRPPRDCLREAYTADLFAVWKKRGRQAIRQLCEENPAAYLRLVVGVASPLRKSGD